MITVARVFVTSIVVFSYPLQAHPARSCLLSVYAAWNNEKEDDLSPHVKWIRYVAVTVSFTCCPFHYTNFFICNGAFTL